MCKAYDRNVGASMNSRYEVLSNKKAVLYAEGSPVILCAKALTKDNTTGKVLAQIRFRNIQNESVTRLTVTITPKDDVGRVIGDAIQHIYLDLSVPRDGEFGTNDAIYFEDATVRDYDVTVEECVLSGTVVRTVNKVLEAVPAAEELHFGNPKMLAQYQKEINRPEARYRYQVIGDLWRCVCGEYNLGNEQNCHHCGVSKAAIEIEPDLTKLQDEIDQQEKIDQEEQEKAQEELRVRKEADQKKQKKIAIIAAVFVAVACVVLAINKDAILENMARKQIEGYIAEGDYDGAFDRIGNSVLTDTAKDEYYLQIIDDLYSEDDYSGAKKYVDSVVSDQGKADLSEIQLEFYKTGKVTDKNDLWDLKHLCINNGSLTQEQADDIEKSIATRKGWPSENVYNEAQKWMTAQVSSGKVLLDTLFDYVDQGIEFENTEHQEIVETAREELLLYKGIYKGIDKDAYPKYYLLQSDGLYYGVAVFGGHSISVVSGSVLYYYISDGALGDNNCRIYKDGGVMMARFGKNSWPLQTISESELPTDFMETVSYTTPSDHNH